MSSSRDFGEFYSGREMAEFRLYFAGMSSGLLTVAALTPPSHEIEFIDENVETVDFTREYDLVGITGVTQQSGQAYRIADEFRRRGTTVVLGGLHATLLPDEAKAHADAVVIGEAENVWVELLRDREQGRLKPFYSSDSLADMTRSPIPRFDLLQGKGYKVFWVQATRGCPHDCSFCAASRVFGSKYRWKTAGRVLEEIRLLKSLFSNFKLNFADDNLFVSPRLYEPLLEGLGSMRLFWFAQTDISIAEKDEVLKKIAAAGCVTLFIGLESLTPEGLQTIDKRKWKLSKLEKYADYVTKIQSYGIGVMGSFIAGLDSDDESVFDRVIDFMTRTSLYGLEFSILTPYPSTRVAEQLRAEGRLLDSAWEKYTSFDVNFVPLRMTPESLQAGILKAYRACYSPEHRTRVLRNMRAALKNRGFTYRWSS